MGMRLEGEEDGLFHTGNITNNSTVVRVLCVEESFADSVVLVELLRLVASLGSDKDDIKGHVNSNNEEK